MSTLSIGVRRPAVVTAAALGILGLTAGTAFAYWTTAGHGTGSATTSTVNKPTAVTGNGTSKLISWTQSNTSAVAPTGFLAERSSTTGTRNWIQACTAPAGATSCTDIAAVTATDTFVFRVTAKYSNAWTAVSDESATPVTYTVAATVTVSTPNLAAASDTGTSNTDNVTKTTTPTFTGTATAGATVQIFDGTTVVGTGPATGGTYSITTSSLTGSQTGTPHTITAKATVGTTTVSSAGSLSVTVDNAGPSGTAIGFAPTGTPGVVSTGDAFTFTFNEPVAPGSLVSGWDGSGTRAITITLVDGGSSSNDSITFGALTIGTLGLGDKGYATSSSTASANVSQSGNSVTVTLTSTPSSAIVGGNGSQMSKTTWSSITGNTDLAGNLGIPATVDGGNIQNF